MYQVEQNNNISHFKYFEFNKKGRYMLLMLFRQIMYFKFIVLRVERHNCLEETTKKFKFLIQFNVEEIRKNNCIQ